MESLVNFLFVVMGFYLLAGGLFAAAFVVVGVRRVDASAQGSTRGFRVIIVPGVVALWPWLAWRWVRGTAATERNAHRDRAANRLEVPR